MKQYDIKNPYGQMLLSCVSRHHITDASVAIHLLCKMRVEQSLRCVTHARFFLLLRK